MQINTLYQLLSMSVQKSALLDVAQTLVTMPDLFNYWLSGQITNEFTNATTTQCFDPLKKSWAIPVLDALGIPSRLFHSVAESGSVIGTLLPAVADETRAGEIPNNPSCLPRHRLSRCGSPSPESGFRLDQFWNVVDYGR